VKVPEGLSAAFISRAFKFSFRQDNVVVHACELFGTLFQVPQNVDASGDRAPYLFDQLSLKQKTSRLRQLELARLRNMGLVLSGQDHPEEDDEEEEHEDDAGDDEGEGSEEEDAETSA